MTTNATIIVVHVILHRQTNHEKKKISAIKTAINNAGPAQGYFSFPDSKSFMLIYALHQFSSNHVEIEFDQNDHHGIDEHTAEYHWASAIFFRFMKSLLSRC